MKVFVVVLCTLFVAPAAGAYEVDTHAWITDRGVARSALVTDVGLGVRMGISRYLEESPFEVPQPLRNLDFGSGEYLDLVATAWTVVGQADFRHRVVRPYDTSQMPEPLRSSLAPPLSLAAWLMRGAIREDDLPVSSYGDEEAPDADPHGEFYRVFHHFYDPVNDRPLTVLVACDSLPGVSTAGPCRPSPDWAFGTTNADQDIASPADANRRNHFSWADGREAMWCGLTYRRSAISPQVDAATRRLCWATAMKSLGHVLHLLQDAAQPQHTRNDRHNPTRDGDPVGNALIATDTARRLFEVYVNWRATGGTEVSAAEFEKPAFVSLFGTPLAAPPLLAANYPKPSFAAPIDFFTTRRTTEPVPRRHGLADFSNRNFFSDGTVFSTEYPSPPANPDDPSLTRVAAPPRFLAGVGTYQESEWRGPLVDTVSPDFADAALAASGGRVPLVREGLWRGTSTTAPRRWQVLPADMLGVHADVLIPRAVAYSTGMIDFFFRGTLDVAPPADGAIAAIDHSTPHVVDAAGYPRLGDGRVFGFNRIRMAARNTTPAIVTSGAFQTVPQSARGGDLVAIARFHRNPCYSADLKGELTIHFPDESESIPAGGACGSVDALRTPYEEIAVSAPIRITNQLDGAAPFETSFDFTADPIPVNAVDLRVQLAYRGQLGDERDGIAVGIADVDEPIFIGMINHTDYYATGGVWHPSSPTNEDPAKRPSGMGSITFDLRLPPWTSGVRLFSMIPILPASRFNRAVVLVADAPRRITLGYQLVGGPPRSGPFDLPDLFRRQGEREELAAGEYRPDPIVRYRGASFSIFTSVAQVLDGPSDFGDLPDLQSPEPFPGGAQPGPGLNGAGPLLPAAGATMSTVAPSLPPAVIMSVGCASCRGGDAKAQ